RNGGNDWELAMLRDPLMTGLTEGLNIGYQAYRPVVVFLNGAYWGIHNLREHLDRFFLEDHYGVDSDNLDIIEANYGDYYIPILYADEGDMDAYWALQTYVEENDLSNQDLFDSVNTMMNVENFINYQLSEIFFANSDWPGNNNRTWRECQEAGEFEWLIFDMDHGFKNHTHNTLLHAVDENSQAWQNSPQSTLLLRMLLENDGFRSRFITRFCDLINFNFKTEHMLAAIDQLAGGIADEMPLHIQRWYPDHDWQSELNWLIDFASQRVDYISDDFQSYFNLDAPRFIYVDCLNPEYGTVKLNGFLISEFPVLTHYFPGLQLEFSAEAHSGYSFTGWSGYSSSDEPLMTVSVDGNISIQCSFGVTPDYSGEVVITEINYHSADDFDPGDWIELFALGGNFDLSGWQLKDENDDNIFEFQEGTFLNSSEFLVIARSLNDFQTRFPDVWNAVGSFEFGLNNSGDAVRLYDQNSVLVDSVAYLDEPPWPTQADGQGSTLQLINPALPNDEAQNWMASLTLHGTPGRWTAIDPDLQDVDLNGDGTLDILDVVITVFCILDYPGMDCTAADLDGNGQVDILDVVILVDWILTIIER
ncbi:MAG: CotH kinase family protein, partial [FCB group bacterium]|nr:CotH kinase family protein [FCB group bacterium]